MDVWELAERLDAAASMADELHVDLCPVWSGQPCACGIPAVVIDAADYVRGLMVERAVTQVQRAA